MSAVLTAIAKVLGHFLYRQPGNQVAQNFGFPWAEVSGRGGGARRMARGPQDGPSRFRAKSAVTDRHRQTRGGGRRAQGGAMGPRFNPTAIGLGCGKKAGSGRQVGAFAAAVVAGAVQPFVVPSRQGGQWQEGGAGAGEDAFAMPGVQAQLVTLVFRKTAGPGPCGDRQHQFANVMHPSCPADRHDLALRQPHQPGRAFSKLCNRPGMTDAVGHAHVNHVGDHKTGRVDLDPRHLGRGGVERAYSVRFGRAIKAGQQVSRPGKESIDQYWIIGTAPALADQNRRLVHTERVLQQDRVLRQCHDPHWHGDRRTLQTRRQAAPIPAFVKLAEATADRFGQAKARRDALGHFAMPGKDRPTGSRRLHQTMHKRQSRRLHRGSGSAPLQALITSGRTSAGRPLSISAKSRRKAYSSPRSADIRWLSALQPIYLRRA